ncbi:hypothetical protein [Jiulongibacter sediminis]|uniref:Uncharacterized protein n=1 Tax=Jiulongibacter sediminis TaxID=1605367 RepID=A0A0P7BUT1_9BACT|nr:hypothetical protein [Jiulongibacter sediminis]KPM48593.1 hypothetical protein AFM12_08255 [Jiulongibacter sediminis]TBX25131.1 hypothetical protein TK44_08260 [Jiulongibacter sediminis]
MKGLIILLVFLLSFSGLFAQETELALDIKEIEIYHIMKNLTKGHFVRTNGEFELTFEIDEKGIPHNLKVNPAPEDSILQINRFELEQLRFKTEGKPQQVLFKIFSHYTTPSSKGEDRVWDKYDIENLRFHSNDGELLGFLEHDDLIELRPFLYMGISCGTGNWTPQEIPQVNPLLKPKLTEKLILPNF